MIPIISNYQKVRSLFEDAELRILFATKDDIKEIIDKGWFDDRTDSTVCFLYSVDSVRFENYASNEKAVIQDVRLYAVYKPAQIGEINEGDYEAIHTGASIIANTRDYVWEDSTFDKTEGNMHYWQFTFSLTSTFVPNIPEKVSRATIRDVTIQTKVKQ